MDLVPANVAVLFLLFHAQLARRHLAGLQVLDHVRFNPNTRDFTAIFNQIASQHADVIITGISGVPPAYDGYSTYDMVHILAEAAARAGTTEPDKMLVALEESDHVGTIGREQFYGREHESTHALKYGPGLVTGVNIQWQNGKQVCVWPGANATAKIAFPVFVKLPKQAFAH
jgi:hypothetical protein